MPLKPALSADSPGSPAPSDANVADILHALEAELQTSSVRSDPARLALLFAENFREFGSSGRIFSRDAILAEFQTESQAVPQPGITMHDFQAAMLSEAFALVTYRAEKSLAGVGHASLRSSLWTNRSGAWQILFHQGTSLSDPARQSSP